MMLSLLEQALGCGGIIAYHGVRESDFLPSLHVTPKALRDHTDFLSASYDVIPLHEFVARRKQGRSVRRCVAITFDDAYAGVLTHALPILEQAGLPATVFVAKAFCRAGARFWWDRLPWVLQRLAGADKDAFLHGAGLTGLPSPHELREHIVTHHRGALPRNLDRALRQAESQVGLVPERAMSSEELRQLSRSDLVDFGCHSAHHYALPWLTPAKAEREIRSDHEWLQERLPRVRPFLAYPYGLYVRATIAAARRCGMEAAFSIEGRAATSHFPLFYCSRVGVADASRLRGIRLRLAWATIPALVAREGGWHPRLHPPASPGPERTA